MSYPPECCSKCKKPYTREEKRDMLKKKRLNGRLGYERAIASGRHYGFRRIHNFDEIRELHNGGASVKEICEKLKCSGPTVSRAVNRSLGY